MKTLLTAFVALVATFALVAAVALEQPSDIVVDPNQGHTSAQQRQDHQACSRAAMRQAGAGEPRQPIFVQTPAACMAGRGYAVK